MVLSIAELRRRVAVVREESIHLVNKLPPDSVHNKILRLADLDRYVGLPPSSMSHFVSEKSRDRVARLTEENQRDLSRFFWAWDNGRLVKGKTAQGWRIVSSFANAAVIRPDVFSLKNIEMKVNWANAKLRGL